MATDPHDNATAQIQTLPPRMGMVRVELIEESLTNPRKHFDQAKLCELADSIAATGVHQPILLRPLPGSRVEETSLKPLHPQAAWPLKRDKRDVRPAYELVAGARRLRACRIANVAEVPAMIRDMTDAEALEVQLIENLQREDMSELEEAEGYRALMEHSQLTVAQVADKIGKGDQKNKGKSYVYARLKLLDLHADARQALAEGEIDSSRALRIARIPDAKLQAKALAEASRKNYRGDFAMGVREFEAWLQQNVMLRLEGARFTIAAADLVPDAGSCTDCPNRTGANPDLFADVNGPDLCTLPKCYHAKEAAHSEQLRKQAEAKGMRVIEGKEAKAVVNLNSWDGLSNTLKGYSRLDSIRHDVTGHDRAPLRTLLGDAGPQPVLIEHPQTKELIEAVPTDEAEAVLVQRGVLQATSAKIDVEQRISQLKASSARKQEQATSKALYKTLMEAALSCPQPGKAMTDAELLREFLKAEVSNLDADDKITICGLETIDNEEWNGTESRALARIDRAKDGEVRNMFIAWLISLQSYTFGRPTSEELTRAFSRALGVDSAAVVAEAVKQEKADLKEAVANLRTAAKAQEEHATRKAAAQKGTSTPPPAAQASPTRAKAKGKKSPDAPAGDEAPKISKAHAAAQIAEALAALEDHGQAPTAQGDEAPAVPGGQPAASALPQAGDGAAAQAHDVAPTAQSDEPPPVADAQAAAAPGGENGADVGNGAAAEAGKLSAGQVVRVKPTATAPKKAPYIGMEGELRYLVGQSRTNWRVAFPQVVKRGMAAVETFNAAELEVVDA